MLEILADSLHVDIEGNANSCGGAVLSLHTNPQTHEGLFFLATVHTQKAHTLEQGSRYSFNNLHTFLN